MLKKEEGNTEIQEQIVAGLEQQVREYSISEIVESESGQNTTSHPLAADANLVIQRSKVISTEYQRDNQSGTVSSRFLTSDSILLSQETDGVITEEQAEKTKTVRWRTPLKDIIYLETTTYSEERKNAAALKEKSLPKSQRRVLAGSKNSLKRIQWMKQSALPTEEAIEEHLKEKERKTRNTDKNENVAVQNIRIDIIESKSGRKCFFVIKNRNEATVETLIKNAKTKLKIKGKKTRYILSTENNGNSSESLEKNPVAFQEALETGSVLYLVKQ